ncbi:hypothetical protein Tco_1459916, partial [Tanacetum coccineum]
VVEGSKIQAEGSSKRTGEELESDNSKKQKIDENVEAEVDDEAEMKKLMEIVLDDEKLVKAKHGNTRPDETYERVLWGDLKVMFEPDVEKEMDLETAQTTNTAKLPILKQGEYDMWRLRIKQYFQVQDYALWDVIENGNSFKPATQTTINADGTSTSLIPGPNY